MDNTLHSGDVRLVVADYQVAYTDPLMIAAGETLTVGANDTQWPGFVWCTNRNGKGGWVPDRCIERRGEIGIARYDYSAAELAVTAGEEVTVEQEESGWLWVTNRAGQSGWIPAEHVE